MNAREKKIIYSLARDIFRADDLDEALELMEYVLGLLGFKVPGMMSPEAFEELGGVSLYSKELVEPESQSLSISKTSGMLQARVAAGQKLTLGDPLAVDLSVPRVWVGPFTRISYWFTDDDGSWHHSTKGCDVLRRHEVFIAGTQPKPKPTRNPADDMDTPLAKCDRVDW